jgi:glycosyltransferase involved in cell wall biosynthesis
MRVCILNEFFYPDMMGGTAKVLSELARCLADDYGAQVSVVTSQNSYRDRKIRYAPEEDWSGIEIHRVSSPHWKHRSTPQRLLSDMLFVRRAGHRMLRRVDCDVVLTSSAPAMLPTAAQTYLHRRGVPYVYVVYDLDPDRAVALGVAQADTTPVRVLRKHQRRWLHGAHTVVAIGRCMKEHLVKSYGVSEDRVVVAEVGADPDTVRPLPKDTYFRRIHNIRGFVVLYSGNFGKYHDFDTVLDAAKLVAQADPDVSFVLVGQGAKKAHLAARIDREGIDNVRMHDFVPDAEYADLLASADLSLVTLEAGMEGLCVPSKFYSIMASGRPTLAVMRPHTEVVYVVRDADCGVHVELSDAPALAATVIKLKGEPARLESMGRNARKAFDSNFTTPLIGRKIERALASAAGGNRR